jgi:hypothetical protein
MWESMQHMSFLSAIHYDYAWLDPISEDSTFNLKGLSHEIDFKNFDQNLKNFE